MNDRKFLIDCDELLEQLGEDRICIVDCRFDLKNPSAGFAKYLENHLPGAVFADLDKDLASPVSRGSGRHPLPDIEAFCASMGRLGIGPDTLVVCYDESSGGLAARLWWLLRWLGHENVCVLNGGMAGWQAEGLPLESGAVKRTHREFHGAPQADRVLETAEIVATGAARLALVDARDRERYAGRTEPIDPVAGHIPGARNLPFTEGLNEDGTWKSADELHQVLEEALGSACGAPWSVMCGSGVTACHLAISALLAGLPEPRLYVGSWSEWITDPDRPIATGPGIGA
ncbi:MAG: sulfurtransferase [Woeseiaceae bacterium]|nr:sulfurtransferase [Woeseiaceae bacterium]NIP20357.1 sulfurtransferase [Woeseiaceae bacterium]NIS89247.1 sulfurtransferase [Woeseiaceae bacterium]